MQLTTHRELNNTDNINRCSSGQTDSGCRRSNTLQGSRKVYEVFLYYSREDGEDTDKRRDRLVIDNNSPDYKHIISPAKYWHKSRSGLSHQHSRRR